MAPPWWRWQCSHMRRICIVFSVLALSFLGVHAAVHAARTPVATPLPPTDVMEIVVFEVDGCTYCGLFRRDVLPAYRLSPPATTVPIRFVDLADGTGGLKLDSPVDVVPTAVLVKNNRETGRISGYSGPDNFFQLMRHLLSRDQ